MVENKYIGKNNRMSMKICNGCKVQIVIAFQVANICGKMFFPQVITSIFSVYLCLDAFAFSSPVQAWATEFGSEVLNTLVKIPVVVGGDWAWNVKFNLFSKSCLFASLLRLWNICETYKKRMKRSLFHIMNSYAHICSPTETCHGPWNSRVVS